MEWNGGIAYLLMILLVIISLTVMLMTLMQFFLIYRFVKKDSNQKKREGKADDANLQKEEEQEDDSNSRKQEAMEDDKIKKKEEGDLGSGRISTINISLNVSGNDDIKEITAFVERIENGITELKSAVYSKDCLKDKNEKDAATGKKQEIVFAERSDIKLLPDFSQDQEGNQRNTKNARKESTQNEQKSNKRQIPNSSQSPESDRKNTTYVSRRNGTEELNNLEEINKIIAERGYGKWMKNEWKRIKTNGDNRKIGDKLVLSYGEGNIRIIEGENGYHCKGVPAKEEWKGLDLNTGAFSECYEVSGLIEDNMNYRIVRIDKLAILYKKNDQFSVYTKGKVQVERL